MLLPIVFPERAAVQQAQGAARPIHSWPGDAAAEISAQFDQLLNLIQESLSVETLKRGRGRSARKAKSAEAKRGFFHRKQKEA